MLFPINEDIIKEIVQINSAEDIGICISLMTYYYMKEYNITESEIFKALKNSINILKNDEED